MTRNEATQELKKLFDVVGKCFHPDNDFKDYVDEDYKPCFSDEEIVKYDKILDDVFGVLGEDIYDVCLPWFES